MHFILVLYIAGASALPSLVAYGDTNIYPVEFCLEKLIKSLNKEQAFYAYKYDMCMNMQEKQNEQVKQ